MHEGDRKMPIITVKLQTPVRRTFRVEQVAGMFDVPLGEVESRKSKVESQKCGTTFDFGPSTFDSVRHELSAEVPGLNEPWTIGAIVGPSGSGKTTLAKAAFGSIYKPRAWPKDRAIIDVVGDGLGLGSVRRGVESGQRKAESRQIDIKRLTQLLVAVGLGSPPTWLKPYHVLSGGERFRADLLRG